MISTHNQPYRTTSSDQDFTEENYIRLLRLAKKAYSFSTYQSIPWGTRFVLWRHDLDYSVTRASALAEIEAETGICATYFINPRSEFYNPFEPGPARLIRGIATKGHRLGLHFDAKFYDLRDEEDLNKKVETEARWLVDAFDVEVDAFSFHNPVASHLECNASHYGGLVNCYSRELQSQVSYCSDSNGYWRFRRLYDVLSDAVDPCLQVLTHPGWWHKRPIEPRRRIFFCVYGRAQATMRQYDASLSEAGRVNHGESIDKLRFLKPAHDRMYVLYDYLWNQEQFDTLFFELWRLYRLQVMRLCKMLLLSEWGVSEDQVAELFEDGRFELNSKVFCQKILGRQWRELSGMTNECEEAHRALVSSLTNGQATFPKGALEERCASLCRIICALSDWGVSQPMAYDGIEVLDTDGVRSIIEVSIQARDSKMMKGSNLTGDEQRRWEELLAVLAVNSSQR